jgi:hypothetical protein
MRQCCMWILLVSLLGESSLHITKHIDRLVSVTCDIVTCEQATWRYTSSTFASAFHVKWSTQKTKILTHCRRELMQSVWKIILSDEDFMHAYLYGMIIKCIDGIERRIYPRVFTYSADYPEKWNLLICHLCHPLNIFFSQGSSCDYKG